jgi:glycosyltransferase involved in cell wall biosynthesis
MNSVTVRPMHVMVIASGRAINGAVRHALILAQTLRRRGNWVTFVLRPDAPYADDPLLEGLAVERSSLRRIPRELARMARHAREHQVDVVSTHMSSAHAFGALLRLFWRIPCVATAHNAKLQLHWAVNDRVIATSHATARFHRRVNLVLPWRIRVVHNFIDPAPFAGLRAEHRQAVRAELELAPEDVLVLCVGDIVPRKRQVDLVEARACLAGTAPRIVLIFLGGFDVSPSADAMRAASERGGLGADMRILGWRPDVRRFLGAADVFALPSAHESGSLALLEAMAAGLPILSTTAGGTPEIVLHGETGLLVAPGDVAALAEGLARLAGDPALRAQFGAAGAARVAREFATETQVARIEAVLAEVARRR